MCHKKKRFILEELRFIYNFLITIFLIRETRRIQSSSILLGIMICFFFKLFIEHAFRTIFHEINRDQLFLFVPKLNKT